VTVPQVGLAGQTFANVPAILSEGGNDRDPAQMTNVGIGLLKRFKVDLDLGRDRVYLTPRSDAPPFDRDRAGARFDLLGDRLKVVFVSPEGPAAAAGLKQGDEVTAVDGVVVSSDYFSRVDWSKAKPGTKVELTRADGSKVAITLADYF
jgi:predicted metalloprotease with PDZ domain